MHVCRCLNVATGGFMTVVSVVCILVSFSMTVMVSTGVQAYKVLGVMSPVAPGAKPMLKGSLAKPSRIWCIFNK